MMRAAKPTSILWAAHVLPLYVTCFDLEEDEAIKLLVELDLLEWVQGSKKSVILKELAAKFNSVFLSDSSVAGRGYLHPNTGVPDQR
jgi:hypothetical protein